MSNLFDLAGKKAIVTGASRGSDGESPQRWHSGKIISMASSLAR